MFELQLKQRRGNIPVSDLAVAEKAIGFSPSLYGIWSDTLVRQAVRFAETIYYDWVHSALQHGCGNAEFDYLLQGITEADARSFAEFTSGWKFSSVEFTQGVSKCRDAVLGGSIGGHSRPSATDTLAMLTICRCLGRCNATRRFEVVSVVLRLHFDHPGRHV